MTAASAAAACFLVPSLKETDVFCTPVAGVEATDLGSVTLSAG